MKQNDGFRRSVQRAVEAVIREVAGPARALGLPARGTAKAAADELGAILEIYGIDELPEHWREIMPPGVAERAECLYAVEQIRYLPSEEGRNTSGDWVDELADAEKLLRRAFPRALRQRLAPIEDGNAKAV
ncbi:MAG TPA: hypothetical protein VMV27_00680 [Candidatus Binataceae bacterium]|nr:hypothetical protein [Candidatus Binataceae bacterium]